jgi:hypothetical protein
MKIKRTVKIEITMTKDEIERKLLDALPKRFTGDYFRFCWQDDGSVRIEKAND